LDKDDLPPSPLEVVYVVAKRKYLKITEQHVYDVQRWKQHYGLRVVGVTTDDKRVISGLDIYKFNTSLGIDLELILTFLDQHKCTIDWLTYVKSATVEGMLMSSILKKISYPIIEVHGERHWLEIKTRIMLWFIEYMNETI